MEIGWTCTRAAEKAQGQDRFRRLAGRLEHEGFLLRPYDSRERVRGPWVVCLELPRDARLFRGLTSRPWATLVVAGGPSAGRPPFRMPSDQLCLRTCTWSETALAPSLIRSGVRSASASRTLNAQRRLKAPAVVIGCSRRILRIPIELHLGPTTLKHLGAEIGVSTRTIRRAGRTLGIDFRQALALARLTASAAYREETRSSWTGVALQAGYAGLPGLSQLARRTADLSLEGLEVLGSVRLMATLERWLVPSCEVGSSSVKREVS